MESGRQGFAGGCYINGTGICVTKPETYCDTATFVPTHYLRVNTGHPLRYCTYTGEMEKVIIGRCGGKHGKCSNLHSRCNDSSNSDSDNNGGGGNINGGDCDDDDCDGNRGGGGNGNGNTNGNTDEVKEENQTSSFIEYDPTCTITQDLSLSSTSSLVSNTYVTYGKCNDRCVWSSDDCLPDEIYSLNDPTCTADKVQIGACFAGHAFCAVDASSCTTGTNTQASNGNIPDEPYWSHQEVKEKIGTNCFLSSLPVVPTPAQQSSSASTSTVDSNTSIDETTTSTTANSNLAMGGENLFSNTTTTPDGLNTGALVAIVTVVAIVVGVAIGILGAVRFNNSNNKRKEGTNGKNINDDEDDDENALTADNLNTLIQQHQQIPIEDIEISMDDNENNNNDDANSELSEENYHKIIMEQKSK